MELAFSIINVVGVLATIIVSAITLFHTRNLQMMQQKVNIMVNKRSERIDSMRKFSADILTCAKLFLHKLDDEKTKKELLYAVDSFNSLLQYAYKHDVELIDCANDIVRLCLAGELDSIMLNEKIEKFWSMCDIYVGVEYERLKIESQGTFNKSGAVKSESNTFEQIYQKLANEQNSYFSSKK
ncbi:MAG: hypothetical protein ACI4QI_00535 [Candidatus Coproplasma sp.]